MSHFWKPIYLRFTGDTGQKMKLHINLAESRAKYLYLSFAGWILPFPVFMLSLGKLCQSLAKLIPVDIKVKKRNCLKG